MQKVVLCFGLALALVVGVAQASTTGFDASLTNVTKPDRVGLDITLKLSGKITTSGGRIIKNCRHGRPVNLSWVTPKGVRTHGNATFPTRRSGRIPDTEISLDYGLDVPESGGTFKLTISTPKIHVPGKRMGEDYICKRLKETLQIDIPPVRTF